MANTYLRSTDGSDGDDGSTWALADATLTAAIAAAGAGGRVYVSDDHSESGSGSLTLNSPGTAPSPQNIICVDDAGSPEPPTALATTAIVAAGTGIDRSITFNGFAYYYGITFRPGTSGAGSRFGLGTAAAGGHLIFDNCVLQIMSTTVTFSVMLGVGSDGNPQSDLIEWINTTFRPGAVGDQIYVNNHVLFHWRGGSISTVAPTTLFVGGNTMGGGRVVVEGVDLSIMGSGKNLVDVSASAQVFYEFINCKLGSSVAITTGSIPGPERCRVRLVNCDSADTNYRYYLKVYEGEVFHESTIVRTGGASDGTTSISRKMVSTANSSFYRPLVSDPIIVWNETTGSSKTVTVEVVTDGVTLTDAEAWIEVEYLGTSGFPQSSRTNDRAASILATAANQTSSSETWTTTGLGSPVKQALSVSFTPQEKGPIAVRVCLAKASTTMYFCPKVTVT